MQDPDDPPVEEGETGGGVAVVRPTVAGTAQAVIASSMAASIPPPWITVTARHLAAMDPGQDASVPASHLPTRKQSPSRCRNGKMLIPKLKSKLKKGTSIIGFLSHVQGDLKQKAHEVGCDMVLPRSAFSQNLPQLLRRHGAPEEENVS